MSIAAAAALERQPARRQPTGDDLREPFFGNGNLTPSQSHDAGLVDVGAHDVMAEMGEKGTGGQADVASADDADAHRLGGCI